MEGLNVENNKKENASNEYVYDINEEYKNGNNSSQIIKVVETWLKEHYQAYDKVTETDFYSEPSTVDEYVGESAFGKSDYINNNFITINDKK